MADKGLPRALNTKAIAFFRVPPRLSGPVRPSYSGGLKKVLEIFGVMIKPCFLWVLALVCSMGIKYYHPGSNIANQGP